MTTIHHTDIAVGAAADAATFNTPLGQLDSAIAGLDTGWTSDSSTWTYASAATFTLVGDASYRFPAGSKVKLTQTTVKFFYVIGAVYSAPNTTVTLTAGGDYALASAAITSPAYSVASTPHGFPQWFNWVPNPQGFSTPPTVVGRFCIIGRTVKAVVFTSAGGGGTSNATTFTMTAPVPSTSGVACVWASPLWETVDNNAGQASPGVARIPNSSSTITLYKTLVSGVWTNSGTKYASFSLDYEL